MSTGRARAPSLQPMSFTGDVINAVRPQSLRAMLSNSAGQHCMQVNQYAADGTDAFES